MRSVINSNHPGLRSPRTMTTRWKRSIVSIHLAIKYTLIACAAYIIISHVLFCCKFPKPLELFHLLKNHLMNSPYPTETSSQQEQQASYHLVAKQYTKSGNPGKFWTVYKVPEFPEEATSAINPGQIYLFHGSGKLELTRMTACALESYAFNNYNRDVYLFVNQEYLAWKRLYADVLLSMPNFKVLQTPTLELMAKDGVHNDVITIATVRRIIAEEADTKHVSPASATVLRWVFLYVFGGTAANFDDEWIPTKQFGKEFTNFVACRTTNASCHLAGEYPVGFEKGHDFLGHFLERLQKEDSRSLGNWTVPNFATNWSMEDLLLNACQNKINAGKYSDLRNCSGTMNVLVLFASKALMTIDQHNKKDFFHDDKALIGLKSLASKVNTGAHFLSCKDQRCEKNVGAVSGGCHALTRFMGNNCPKIRRVVELESLCDDPWGILRKYVEVEEVVPFCTQGPVPSEKVWRDE